jgi:hypothetical protein
MRAREDARRASHTVATRHSDGAELPADMPCGDVRVAQTALMERVDEVVLHRGVGEAGVDIVGVDCIASSEAVSGLFASHGPVEP